jgi:S1-C subfamily serine protease
VRVVPERRVPGPRLRRASARRPPRVAALRSRRAAAAGALALAVVTAAVLLATAPPAGPPPSGPALVEVLVVPSVGPPVVATGFERGRGRVVTVAHLLSGRHARVLVRDPEGRAHPATALRVDRRDDLAVLSVRAGPDRGGARPMLPGSGETSLLVRRAGRPVALPVRVRRRINARIRPAPGAAPVRRAAIELDARVRGGDSGAPLVDADGRLLGVLFASSRSRDDTAYAVVAERLAALARR